MTDNVLDSPSSQALESVRLERRSCSVPPAVSTSASCTELSPDVVRALRTDFGVGLILGPSGSGKSTMLRIHFQNECEPRREIWDTASAVISHFETPEIGVQALMDCGLNTVPSWLRPYHVLSTGEKRRASLARNLRSGHHEDEFTSELDRRTAMAVAVAVGRRCRKLKYTRVVFASCHSDIACFLQPDWVLWMPQGRLLWNPVPCPTSRLSVSLDIEMEQAILDKREQTNLNHLFAQGDEWKACGIAQRSVKSLVSKDAYTELAATIMEVPFNGISKTIIPQLDGELRSMLPRNFRIGLIVGPSGTGKSSLLRQFGEPLLPQWQRDVPLADHFRSTKDAEYKLRAADLRIIALWGRSYETLSVGEQHRADIARSLRSGARIDEFTSTVDRAVAVSIAASVSTLIRAYDFSDVVFASCHDDIQEALAPDWIYNVVTHSLFVAKEAQHSHALSKSDLDRLLPPAVSQNLVTLAVPTPEYLFTPARLQIHIERCGRSAWQRFAPYHYLSGKLGSNAMCFAAVLDFVGASMHDRKNIRDERVIGLQSAVGFVAAIPLCGKGKMLHGTLCKRGAYRESRLVVVPELQGLGLGKHLSESIGRIFLSWHMRYTSKAAHPRVAYREKSCVWRPLPGNGEFCITRGAKKPRRCFNHEYVGTGRITTTSNSTQKSKRLRQLPDDWDTRSCEDANNPKRRAHATSDGASIREEQLLDQDTVVYLPSCKWWPIAPKKI